MNPIYESSVDLADHKEECGANRFDISSKTIEFVVNGDKDC